MYKMVIPATDTSDLQFDGELIAEALGAGRLGLPGQADDAGHGWSELRLYTMAEGGYVCEQLKGKHWSSADARPRVAICGSEAEVFDFFGRDALARELYLDAEFTEDYLYM